MRCLSILLPCLGCYTECKRVSLIRASPPAQTVLFVDVTSQRNPLGGPVYICKPLCAQNNTAFQCSTNRPKHLSLCRLRINNSFVPFRSQGARAFGVLIWLVQWRHCVEAFGTSRGKTSLPPSPVPGDIGSIFHTRLFCRLTSGWMGRVYILSQSFPGTYAD